MTYMYSKWMMNSIRDLKVFTVYDIDQHIQERHKTRAPSRVEISQYLKNLRIAGVIQYIDSELIVLQSGHKSEVKRYRYNGD